MGHGFGPKADAKARYNPRTPDRSSLEILALRQSGSVLREYVICSNIHGFVPAKPQSILECSSTLERGDLFPELCENWKQLLSHGLVPKLGLGLPRPPPLRSTSPDHTLLCQF